MVDLDELTREELLARLRAAEEDAERWRTALRLMSGISGCHYTFKIPAPNLSRWDWQDQFTAAIDAARKP